MSASSVTTSTASPSHVRPLAAVVYEAGFDLGRLLGDVCDRLAARGDLVIGGVLPTDGGLHANGRREMLLRDIGSGRTTAISQELGAGADSCILDPDGFARTRVGLAAAIAAGADLIVMGKFAKREVEGQGIRAEIADCLAAGIPALVALRSTRREAFEAFAGDDWQALAPRVEAVIDWALAATGRPPSSAAAGASGATTGRRVDPAG